MNVGPKSGPKTEQIRSQYQTSSFAVLAAHLHLILQLAKDIGGSQWLAYDQHFREWASASGVKSGRTELCHIWPLPGTLNVLDKSFSIFGSPF